MIRLGEDKEQSPDAEIREPPCVALLDTFGAATPAVALAAGESRQGQVEVEASGHAQLEQLEQVTPQKHAPRRLVRQLLTARRGQRPSVWLDFEDAVQTMLGWEGYKIIQVQLKEPDR